MTRAVFSSVSSLRITRSSSGRRPTSDSVAATSPRVDRPSSPTAAAGGLADEFLDTGHCAGRGLHALRGGADEAHRELPGIRRGQQLRAEVDEQRGTARGKYGGDQHHRAGSAQQPGHNALEAAAAACREGLLLRLPGADALVRCGKEPSSQGGNQEHGDAERRDQRDHDRERDAVDQARRQSLHEEHGQEDDARSQRAGDDCTGHLARALGGGRDRVVAKADAAVHGFHDDDGVVDEHPGTEGETAQGDDVDAVVGEGHQEQGREHGHRYGGRDDQRGAGGTQEQRQHAYGEDDARAGGDLQVVQGIGDEAGVVGDLVGVDARQVFVESGQRLVDFLRDTDRVGARLLVDGEAHAFDAVDQHQVVDLGIDHLDGAEVLDAYRLTGGALAARVVDVSHHDRSNIGGGAEP